MGVYQPDAKKGDFYLFACKLVKYVFCGGGKRALASQIELSF
ncbi:hypothetical protein MuYL_4341 [Mucilaginibacter xinganensis]|uniref:Uncharacterized protein n=1 Tax=Mucilaginibacter xinganensis TaxID=1234841 RepID=A0A223P2B7_9SPHI|nr:hypothetical protein MuYL_4341 [Mucilaginibacter xinganensis]